MHVPLPAILDGRSPSRPRFPPPPMVMEMPFPDGKGREPFQLLVHRGGGHAQAPHDAAAATAQEGWRFHWGGASCQCRRSRPPPAPCPVTVVPPRRPGSIQQAEPGSLLGSAALGPWLPTTSRCPGKGRWRWARSATLSSRATCHRPVRLEALLGTLVVGWGWKQVVAIAGEGWQ